MHHSPAICDESDHEQSTRSSNSDYVTGNKSHFDNVAIQYDDRPGAVKLSRTIASSILKEYHFDEQSTVMMEYACGTGLISRELSPFVKQIIGVDISQGMVDQFNARVAYQGIPPEEMQALCRELKGNESELDGTKFDLIVCSMAYHHFPDIDATTRMLAAFLKQRGTLIVVDLVKRTADNTGLDNKDSHTCHGRVVAHEGGINETQIRTAFEHAGLMEYKYRPCTRIRSKGKEDQLFLARGIKTA